MLMVSPAAPRWPLCSNRAWGRAQGWLTASEGRRSGWETPKGTKASLDNIREVPTDGSEIKNPVENCAKDICGLLTEIEIKTANKFVRRY